MRPYKVKFMFACVIILTRLGHSPCCIAETAEQHVNASDYIEAGRFVRAFSNIVIYVGDKDGTNLKRVVLFESEARGTLRRIEAESGVIREESSSHVELVLHDIRIQESAQGPAQVLDVMAMQLDLSPQEPPRPHDLGLSRDSPGERPYPPALNADLIAAVTGFPGPVHITDASNAVYYGRLGELIWSASIASPDERFPQMVIVLYEGGTLLSEDLRQYYDDVIAGLENRLGAIAVDEDVRMIEAEDAESIADFWSSAFDRVMRDSQPLVQRIYGDDVHIGYATVLPTKGRGGIIQVMVASRHGKRDLLLSVHVHGAALSPSLLKEHGFLALLQEDPIQFATNIATALMQEVADE